MYTTSETDEFALPSRRLLDNHGWLKTCKFRTNPGYKASEGKDVSVSGEIEAEKPCLALRCYDAIFFGGKGALVRLRDGCEVAVRRRFSNNLRCIETHNYLFVEQNPYKRGSKWARLAKEGQKIMWVIEKKTKTYVASVVEGKLSKL